MASRKTYKFKRFLFVKGLRRLIDQITIRLQNTNITSLLFCQSQLNTRRLLILKEYALSDLSYPLSSINM